ncbi:MAG: sensor histidine kinase, partial [Halanaerobium sp.]
NAVKNEKSIKIKLKIEADNILFKFLAVHENLKQKSKYISEADDFKQLIIQKLLQVQSGKLQVKKLANRSLCLIITMPGEAYSDSYQLETGGTYSVKEGDDFETKLETTSSSEKKSIFIFGQQMRNIGYIKEVIAAEDYLIAVFPEKKQLVDNLDSQVSLVIFDLFSLEQSDLKLCSQIRDRFKLFELPILVIVSHNEPENLIRGFESGINDFVQKPFAASELKAKIRTLITLKQKVEESIQREQDFLRAQIRPHFLYNTLDTIAYLCENKPGQASKLVIELANYLRHSFDFNSLDKLISIEKEIELVRFYLNIQQARFEDKINVNYNITTELYFRVPPLILQPLVENAVKHGILPREKGGQITIQITETKDHFVIEVIDDGVGMSEDKLKEVFSDFDGNQRRKVGIRNINRRLKKLYGQKLEIESKKGRGTAVKFKIPHR